jgi:hypothetical protein
MNSSSPNYFLAGLAFTRSVEASLHVEDENGDLDALKSGEM